MHGENLSRNTIVCNTNYLLVSFSLLELLLTIQDLFPRMKNRADAIKQSFLEVLVQGAENDMVSPLNLSQLLKTKNIDGKRV